MIVIAAARQALTADCKTTDGFHMETLKLIAPFVLPPLIGAIIGWFTNFLAVKMLFRPRRPRRILFIRFHGLIPKRHHEIAVSVGEIVERELINHDDLRRAVDTPGFKKTVIDFLDSKLDDVLQTKLKTLSPLITSFVSPALIQSIRNAILNELVKHLPELMDQVFSSLEKEVNFKQMVIAKIEAFEMEKLEGVVLEVAKKEFRMIELLGAVLGAIIGSVQVAANYGLQQLN